jgi:hypothetical protein
MLLPTSWPAPSGLRARMRSNQELGNSLLTERLRPAQRFRFLVLVIEIATQQMMRVVGLSDEIGDGELNLMDPKPLCFVSRSEVVTVAEIKQDGGGLANQDISIPQERRRKRRIGDVVSLQKSHEGLLAAACINRVTGYVDVVRACLFQCQPDELAAPLNAGPVVEFIGHAQTPCAAADSVSLRQYGGASPCPDKIGGLGPGKGRCRRRSY